MPGGKRIKFYSLVARLTALRLKKRERNFDYLVQSYESVISVQLLNPEFSRQNMPIAMLK